MSGFGVSFVFGAATSYGAWYALENKLIDIPQELLALNGGKHIPNLQLALGAGGIIFLGLLFATLLAGSCAKGRDAPAKKSKKKKKKSKKASGAASAAPAPAAAPKKKNKPKKAKKAEEEKPKAQKKKGGKQPTKASGGGKKEKAPAPKKEKSAPVARGGQWGALDNDSDSDSDAAPYAPEVSTSSSKAALRRQRQKENKHHAKEQVKHEQFNQAATIPDEDGWVTHQVKRRVRKTPAQKAAEQAALEQSERSHFAPSNPNDATVEVQVPYQKYGLIIGPKGATLIKLQEATGTRIDVPKSEGGSGKDTVTITGPKEGCVRCKNAIKSLVKEGFSSITDPGKTSASISVEPRFLGIVIGPNGSNIKKIQDSLEVRVNTPDRNSDSNKVTISGEKDAVFKAKEAIKSLMDNGFCAITHPGVVKDYMNFPQSEYHLLIGPGGQTIKSIKGDTNVKIDIPDPNEEEDRVTLIGKPADIARAKVQINNLVDVDYQAAKLAARNAKAGVTATKEDEFDW